MSLTHNGIALPKPALRRMIAALAAIGSQGIAAPGLTQIALPALPRSPCWPKKDCRPS